jgi:acetyl-CoA synthetase
MRAACAAGRQEEQDVLARNPKARYEELQRAFRWRLPASLNLGVACADRQPRDALALIELAADGTRREYTFGRLAELSNRLANGLRALGVRAGDRVAIVVPQRVETGLAHLATYKLGAIAVPLSGLFGPAALRHRLGDSGASVAITDGEHLAPLAELATELGGLRLLSVDGPGTAHEGFWELVQDGSAHFEAAPTGPDTPALLIYTSGTTGSPKGALHGHRVLPGHLPGFELSHDFFPREGDVFWTPADWAWIGGLMDALMPTWYHGRPIVAAAREKFDPEWALHLMASQHVTSAFLPPTALKLMRRAQADTAGVALRSLMCGGEPLGEEVLGWARERLGVTINEIYGQTEANYVVGNSAAVWEVRGGSMGRPYPGHEVAVLGEDGLPVPDGEQGQIAVGAPDPVIFLGYWSNAEATAAKFTPDGRWLLTGDMATRDADGYLWFGARNDDVINSAGYRIGPSEIEECLVAHDAVAMAAAIGVPDEIRGEVVKAFVQLADGSDPSAELEADIQRHVREHLAAYVYPRQIEFVADLPMTTTGKIRRAALRQLESERRGAAPRP